MENPFLNPITNPVGTRLQLKGYTFEVVENWGCDGCFFNRPLQIHTCARDSFYGIFARGGLTFNEAHSLGRCCKDLRTDKKSVIFKLIKQPENNETEETKPCARPKGTLHT